MCTHQTKYHRCFKLIGRKLFAYLLLMVFFESFPQLAKCRSRFFRRIRVGILISVEYCHGNCIVCRITDGRRSIVRERTTWRFGLREIHSRTVIFLFVSFIWI